MQNKLFSIKSPSTLYLSNGTAHTFGANQAWYRTWYQRIAGCGPTTASHLLWYLAATRPSVCGALCPEDIRDRPSMLRFMNQVWRYVTPGFRGVDRASTFFEGAIAYGKDHEVTLAARSLEIPASLEKRPSALETCAFLSAAFAEDLPVAFLNLDRGHVPNLENWHWVTLISVNSGLMAEAYDQGMKKMMDLSLWLATCETGGAFVVVHPQKEGNDAHPNPHQPSSQYEQR